MALQDFSPGQIITLSKCCWPKWETWKKMFVSGMVFNIWDMLIPDKCVNPTSPVHIPYTYNRRGNMAADLQNGVRCVLCLPSWCQADSNTSCAFYVHGPWLRGKAPRLFTMVKSRVYKRWMYERTMAPCGPDLGVSNVPTSTGRVFLREPLAFSSNFAVFCGFKCLWCA